MPRRRVPSYRCYKPKNLGLVVIDGKQHYLGTYGTPESLAEYNRLVQEWLTRGTVLAGPEPADGPAATVLVNEVIVAFLQHAEGHYLDPDGKPTGEVYNLTVSLKPLRAIYGYTPADQFGPLALKAVRDRMIADGLSRSTINARVNRVRRMFRWAASVELVPGTIAQALQNVNGLQRGRSRVKEARGIAPVPVEAIEATLPHLPRPVAAMVQIQLLTGCRAGEVVVMRAQDIAVGEPNWLYRPQKHKNSWRGQERSIILGPRAQAVLKDFLAGTSTGWLFKPSDAVAEHHARRSKERRSKPTPSELARRSPIPGRNHAPRYDRKTYRNAIVRACDRAKVARWSPLQIRHTAATLIRTQFGLEAAQPILGHAKADVTQIYAERDMTKAHAVMAQVG